MDISLVPRIYIDISLVPRIYIDISLTTGLYEIYIYTRVDPFDLRCQSGRCNTYINHGYYVHVDIYTVQPKSEVRGILLLINQVEGFISGKLPMTKDKGSIFVKYTIVTMV